MEDGRRKFISNIKGQIETVSVEKVLLELLVLTMFCQVTDSLASVEKDLNQPINPPTTLLLSHLDSDSAVESFTLYTSLR